MYTYSKEFMSKMRDNKPFSKEAIDKIASDEAIREMNKWLDIAFKVNEAKRQGIEEGAI